MATKEASGNVSAIAKTAALCGDELAIYSGNDDQILPLLALGGIGVISVLANVAPRETHDICRLYFEGKHAESLALQLRLLELIEALFCDVNPIPVKEAMNLLGHDAGQCRMPLAPLNAANRERLRTALCAAGFLKAENKSTGCSPGAWLHLRPNLMQPQLCNSLPLVLPSGKLLCYTYIIL